MLVSAHVMSCHAIRGATSRTRKLSRYFIWHYHTNDLINRESFPKLFDVATPMSRKDGCASVAGVDVANPCVNSSYFQFVMKQMY